MMQERRMKQVEVYTDGACSGNPGPGGWGAVLRYRFNGKVYENIALFTLNGLDVTIQTNSDVFPVVGDRFAAEQM